MNGHKQSGNFISNNYYSRELFWKDLCKRPISRHSILRDHKRSNGRKEYLGIPMSKEFVCSCNQRLTAQGPVMSVFLKYQEMPLSLQNLYLLIGLCLENMSCMNTGFLQVQEMVVKQVGPVFRSIYTFFVYFSPKSPTFFILSLLHTGIYTYINIYNLI